MGIIGAFVNWLLNDDDEVTRKLPEVSYHNFVADDRVFRSKFFRPSRKYVQDLQYCYLQLRNDYGEKHLFDADTMKAQYQELFIKTCELERLHASAQTNEQIYKDQAKLALDWNSNTEKKNVVREQHGLDPIEEKEQLREGSKFASASGRSKIQNQKIGAAMLEFGYTKSAIAATIGIGEKSLGTYLSDVKKHYKVVDFLGKTCIDFDEEYGNERWDLEKVFEGKWEYEEEESAQKVATAPESAKSGVIHHGLEKPFIFG